MRIFWSLLGSKTRILDQIWIQICPLTPSGMGQFLENFKNAFKSLFIGSSRLILPIFVHIGLVGFERQAKTWFRNKIRSNFDLRPLYARSNLQISKKCHYWSVPMVKLLHCANFCPHRTCQIWTTSQNVIL
jgi:hypothetical protein